MKILHVTKKYPQALGGDAVVVSNLRKHQLAAGHKVAVVTSNCREISAGPHIYKVGFKDTAAALDDITARRLASLVVLGFRMFAILRKERPNIIHTHSIDMAFFASFAARLYRIPIVHTFHIVTFYDESQSLLRRKSELWLAKGAGLRCATAPNKFDVENLRTAGLTQTVLLPNGVDLTFWRPGTRAKTPKVFTFVAVGRLERQKGYAYLIKAAALLAKTAAAPFRVIIIGSGSREPLLRNLANAVGADMVSFVGRKNPDETRLLLAQADAAVFPSLYETTPLTLLESWAVGLPVIVTPVGILGDADIGFDAAYVVPQKDEQMLMQAMGQCMGDADARLAIAQKGREEAQQYDWPIIAQTAESIYGSAQ